MSLLCVKRIQEDSISEITIGPAPANIVSEAMIAELLGQIESDENDASCKGIVIVGSGDNFSFGASVPFFSLVLVLLILFYALLIL